MELYTKDGEEVRNLEEYGAIWGNTLAASGWDNISIDMGDVSVFNDFIDTLYQLSDLASESINRLEDEFFNSVLNAIEVEQGAGKVLLENGYIQTGEYSFKL